MAASSLTGKTVAVLATDGYEQIELDQPVAALKAAGAAVHVISLESGRIQGFNHHDKGETVAVGRTVKDAEASDYDALLLPGGVINPDALRVDADAVDFVRAFAKASKPIAAICHGPWTLINAEAVDQKRMTSWPSLEMDLTNAGATWVDETVVVDGNLVTSRKPDDLPAFCDAMIQTISGEAKAA